VLVSHILNYIIECNLQQHWRIYKENGDSGNLTAFEKADSQWEQIINCRLEIWQKTLTSIFSPICSHPNRVEEKKLKYLIREHCIKVKNQHMFLFKPKPI
jgi:hypothetical protein